MFFYHVVIRSIGKSCYSYICMMHRCFVRPHQLSVLKGYTQASSSYDVGHNLLRQQKKKKAAACPSSKPGSISWNWRFPIARFCQQVWGTRLVYPTHCGIHTGIVLELGSDFAVLCGAFVKNSKKHIIPSVQPYFMQFLQLLGVPRLWWKWHTSIITCVSTLSVFSAGSFIFMVLISYEFLYAAHCTDVMCKAGG